MLRARWRIAAPVTFAVTVSSTCVAQVSRPDGADTLQLQHLPVGGRVRIQMGNLEAITVGPEFRYAGGRRFMLTATVRAEQHVFVIADSTRSVQRMLWLQVETRLPPDSGAYAYPSDSLLTVDGLPIRVGVRSYSGPPEATSDRGSAYRLVESAGYSMPVSATRARLVYLPDQPARREVMIIYVETGVSSASGGMGFNDLLGRARAAVRLHSRK